MKNKNLSGMLNELNSKHNLETSGAEFENLNDSLALKIKGGLKDRASEGLNASSCNESGCNNSGCGSQDTSTDVIVA